MRTLATTTATLAGWLALVVLPTSNSFVDAFTTPRYYKPATTTLTWRCGSSSISISSQLAASVGIFYGTSTGSTQECADMIAAQFGDDVADGPFDIETIDADELQSTLEGYDALVVGSPTWNTAADTERSGTGWDELYYTTLPKFNLAGKKVAVFGLGDQVSYTENYADAAGELFDVFESLGCTMHGFTSQEGYEHEDSKTIRGDKFCGLLLDMVNQEELTEDRIQKWVAQLRDEGFVDGGSSSSSSSTSSATNGSVADVVNGAAATATTDTKVEDFFQKMDQHSSILDETIESHGSGGYTPHYNPKSKSTMWVSADGRSCYYTVDSDVATTKTTP
jgi:flavodoxin I